MVDDDVVLYSIEGGGDFRVVLLEFDLLGWSERIKCLLVEFLPVILGEGLVYLVAPGGCVFAGFF